MWCQHDDVARRPRIYAAKANSRLAARGLEVLDLRGEGGSNFVSWNVSLARHFALTFFPVASCNAFNSSNTFPLAPFAPAC